MRLKKGKALAAMAVVAFVSGAAITVPRGCGAGPEQEGGEWGSVQSALISAPGATTVPDASWIPAGACPGAAYYVDNETGIDQGRDGRSWANAWRSVANAVANVPSGATVYVRGTATPYRENIVFGRFATASAPICVIGVQGAAARPTFMDLQPPANPEQPLFKVTGAYWVFKNLHVDKAGSTNLQTFNLSAGAHHIAILDSELENSLHHALRIGATDVHVARSDFHDNKRTTAIGGDYDAHAIALTPPAARVWIHDNRFIDNSGDGVQCMGAETGYTGLVTDLLIEDNWFETTAAAYAKTENAVDIKSCDRVTIRGGIAKGFQASTDGDKVSPGTAIVVHYQAKNVLIEGMEITGCGQGINVGNSNDTVENVVIRRNRIHQLIANRGRAIDTQRFRTLEVYHNTFDTFPGYFLYVGPPAGQPWSNLHVWNNIVSTSHAAVVRLPASTVGTTEATGAGMQFKANLYWTGPTTVPTFYADGTSYKFPAWQGRGNDTDGRHTDPLFHPDAAGNLHRLQQGSWARDHAYPLGEPPRCPTASPPDIGAVEMCDTAGVTAIADGASAYPGTSTLIDVLENDLPSKAELIIETITAQPTSGTVTISVDQKSLTYVAPAGLAGEVSFRYRARSTVGTGTDEGEVTVLLLTPPGELKVSPDVERTQEATAVTVRVAANDAPPGVTVASISVPRNGSASASSDSVVYTPRTQFAGQDRFTYVGRAPSGATASAEVSVNVVPAAVGATAFEAFEGWMWPTPSAALYVDATNGDDVSGTGSAAAPYRTIQRGVNAVQPGQAVYVRSGTYLENVIVGSGARDGSPTMPIVLRADPASAGKPVIRPAVAAPALTVQRKYWIVERLDVNQDLGPAPAVELGLGAENVVLRFNKIHKSRGNSGLDVVGPVTGVLIYWNTIWDNEGFWTGAAYNAWGVRIAPGASQIVLRHNSLYHNAGSGIVCSGAESGIAGNAPDDLLLEDNRVQWNTGTGIDIGGCTRVTVRGGEYDNSKLYGHGGPAKPAACDGAAIKVRHGASGVLIERTRFWENGRGIAIGEKTSTATAVVVRDNLFFKMSAWQNYCGDGVNVDQGENIKVFNNTFDEMPRSALRMGVNGKVVRDVSAFNNILNNAAYALVVWPANLPGLYLDRNVFWKPGATPVIWSAGAELTLAQWQGQEGQDATSFARDPLFIASPRTGDYYTQETSPARDVAIDNTGRTAYGAGPDIGFLESATADVPPARDGRLVAFGSTWKYWDRGSDLGAGWTDPAYSDDGWPSGPAELGFGDGDEATAVDIGPAGARHPTTYFRHEVTLVNAGQYGTMRARLRSDDGVVVHVNGQEAFRFNMPSGAITYSTLASTTIDGAEETEVREFQFNPRLLRDGINVVAVEVHQSTATSSDLTFDLELVGTTAVSPLLVPFGATWKYLADGSNQGSAWKETAFSDASWPSGPAKLGYGTAEDGIVTTVPYGNPSSKYITTYFRKTFQVAAPAAFKSLRVAIEVDDGAVVYLNGTQAFRENMPEETIDYLTLATAAKSDEAERRRSIFTVPAGWLRQGTNVVAVEVHQALATSSDLGLDLELVGDEGAPPTEPPPDPQGTTHFAIIGDYGNGGSNAHAVAAMVRGWNPAFVITTGDNVYESGLVGEFQKAVGDLYCGFIHPYPSPEWTSSNRPAAPCAHGTSTNNATNRFFPSLGNHDVGNGAHTGEPYYAYFTLPSGPGNERYYTFTEGPVQFFALDSNSDRKVTGTQARWLKDAVSASSARWKIVYMHHSPFTVADGRNSIPDLQWPFADWGVDAVIAGHDHDYQHYLVKGVHYFVNGAGGMGLRQRDPTKVAEPQPTRFIAEHGAQRVTATDDRLTFTFHGIRGTEHAIEIKP